jgi:hypothetical protein
MLTRPRLAILVSIGLASAFLYGRAQVLGDLLEQPVRFAWLCAALFVLYLAGAWCLRGLGQRAGSSAIFVILAFAIIFRLLIAFSPPSLSLDINRYAWDGFIQTRAECPYGKTPADPELAKYRSAPVYATLGAGRVAMGIYQPAAQIIFKRVAMIEGDFIVKWKGLLVFLDIIAMLMLLKLMRAAWIPDKRIILYAWSPLVVFEIAGSGHVDGLVAFLVIAAALMAVKRRGFLSGLSLGIAASVKLYPALLLPAIMREKRDIKPLAGFLLSAGLFYLPFLHRLRDLMPFGQDGRAAPAFNPGLKLLIQWIMGGPSESADFAYAILAASALAVLGLAIAAQPKGSRGITKAALAMSGAVIALLPFTAPWYLLLVMPFAALNRSKSFIYLSGAVMLAYLYYASQPWAMPAWVPFVEFIPFALLLFLDIRQGLTERRENSQVPA